MNHGMYSLWSILNNITGVENGDTLHLVERQAQPSPGPSTGEANSNNGSRGCRSCILTQFYL